VDDSIHDSQDALESHPSSWNILLIDSEGPDDGQLFARLRLPTAEQESVFWMVQLMESWFLAGIPALKLYYGKDFGKLNCASNERSNRSRKRTS
jgi:hypothetical protein